MLAENSVATGLNGTVYRLGQQIGSGGEGTVFAVSGTKLVAKIYNNDSPDLEQKLIFMVTHPVPNVADQHGNIIMVLAWPKDVIYDQKGAFVGYVMPFMSGGVEIFEIEQGCTSPAAKTKLPNYTWRLNVLVARNLAAAVKVLHAQNYVIGDMNCKNLMVNADGSINMLDTDSFDVTDPATGNHYKCCVGTEDYLAPELQGKNLSSDRAMFTTHADDFALAIHIFRLLMNNYHPFTCRQLVRPQNSSNENKLMQNVAEGKCPYIHQYPDFDIPMGAATLEEVLPDYIRRDFVRTFNYNSGNAISSAQNRTTAAQWTEDLRRLLQECDGPNGLVRCKKNPSHFYLRGVGECGMCKAQARLNSHIKGKTGQTPSPASASSSAASSSAASSSAAPRSRNGSSFWRKPVVKIAAVIAAALLVFFIAQQFAISEAETAIGQIGTVTMESGSQIEHATDLFNGLSEGSQEKVENRMDLFYAQMEYTKLCDSVSSTCSLIDAIGTVSLSSGTAIQKAQEAYSEARKAGLSDYITNSSILTQAKGKYAQLLVDEGRYCLSQGEYLDAYAFFYEVLDTYPETTAESAAKDGAAEARISLAEQYYSSGQFEDAFYALEGLQRQYTLSDAYIAVSEKLLNRLERQRPRNGEKIAGFIGWGYGMLEVSGGNTDACIKVENLDDESAYLLFYVRAGEETSIKLKNGRYSVKYATGQYWFDEDSLFGRNTYCAQVLGNLELDTIYSGNTVTYSVYTMSLYGENQCNFNSVQIDRSSF